MLRFIFRGSNIIINIFHDVLIQPEPNLIPDILKENHSNPTSGHSGFHKTYYRIQQKYKWHNMKQNIKNYIKTCEPCQRNKLVRKKNKEPMQITTASEKPFERISLDIVSPLPLTTAGNKFILTLQDDLTKFSQAYAIPNHEAVTIANIFVHKFICNFGIPESILIDQGTDFLSKLFQEMSKLFKIKNLKSTAYHPQNKWSTRTHTFYYKRLS